LTKSIVIEQTKKWIKSVVIDMNFCPFAAKAFLKKQIRYTVLTKTDLKQTLEILVKELQYLNVNEDVETTFIIFPRAFVDFENYLDMLETAQELLEQEGYEGIYQLASFHPDYNFEGTDYNDPANYTNRSIYPMLHLLREDSISKALTLYKNSELIPQHNIELARKKGLVYMKMLREACFN